MISHTPPPRSGEDQSAELPRDAGDRRGQPRALAHLVRLQPRLQHFAELARERVGPGRPRRGEPHCGGGGRRSSPSHNRLRPALLLLGYRRHFLYFPFPSRWLRCWQSVVVSRTRSVAAPASPAPASSNAQFRLLRSSCVENPGRRENPVLFPVSLGKPHTTVRGATIWRTQVLAGISVVNSASDGRQWEALFLPWHAEYQPSQPQKSSAQ